MLETVTKSGAVIHTDTDSDAQMLGLPTAIAALGGILVQVEHEANEATA